MRFFAIAVVLVSTATFAVGQPGQEPHTFFTQFIGLEDNQIADMQKGKAVTKVLQTKTPAEVAVFGAIYIHGDVEDYLKAAQNLASLRGSPNYVGIQAFSTPPKLSDLEGFVLEEDDVKDLKNCKPGSCQLQLPAESMEEFKRQVNWSAPDVTVQVNRLAQKMALDELLRYQKDGNAALGSYYDKEQPVHVVEQFEALLRESSSMPHYLPDLEQYLIGYPRTQLANAQTIFYWERVKFGLKPTLRINQMIIYRGTGTSGPIASVAIRQLYASHYFQTALDLSVCAKDTGQADEKGFYLITVKGSRQAGLTGPKGSIVRKNAISRIRASLEGSLGHIRTTLESKQQTAHGQ